MINWTDIMGNAGWLFLYEDITVDGINNWWGNSSGPSHPNNPGGTGDSVEDSTAGLAGTVNYKPWIKRGPFPWSMFLPAIIKRDAS